MSPTIRVVLISKPPSAQPAHQDTCIILLEEPSNPHSFIFEFLDSSIIQSAALKVTGAAGPSGLDPHQWRCLCTSHKSASRDLYVSVASVARRICSLSVASNNIAPLLAYHLIALNKHPLVRPIGIGDTGCKIIAKAVFWALAFKMQLVVFS